MQRLAPDTYIGPSAAQLFKISITEPATLPTPTAPHLTPPVSDLLCVYVCNICAWEYNNNDKTQSMPNNQFLQLIMEIMWNLGYFPQPLDEGHLPYLIIYHERSLDWVGKVFCYSPLIGP